jgi:hypothetical protein
MERRVDDIIGSGQPWTDPDFQPTTKSIIDTKIDASNPSLSNFKWKRASEIYESSAIFSGGIDPNDIQQG